MPNLSDNLPAGLKRPIAFLYPPQPLDPCPMPSEFFAAFPRLALLHDEALDAIEWSDPHQRAAAVAWKPNPTAVGEVRAAHVGIVAFGWALTQLLAEQGITPDVVFGHSLGLHGALAVSGAAPITDALEVVDRTARFLADARNGPEGAMLAVTGFSPDEIADLCAEYTDKGTAFPAIINSRRQVVISGLTVSIEVLACELRQRLPWGLTQIPTRFPLHSLLMAPMAERCAELVEGMHCHVPRIRLVHPATGELVHTVSGVERLWRTHLVSTIDFVRALEQMERLGVATYLEVGPGETLSKLCAWFRRDANVIALGKPEVLVELLGRVAPQAP